MIDWVVDLREMNDPKVNIDFMFDVICLFLILKSINFKNKNYFQKFLKIWQFIRFIRTYQSFCL